MQHRRQGKPTPKAKVESLGPLLLVLRAELGPDWTFYEEFLECVAVAMASGEEVCALFHQIEPLIRGPSIYFAHQGVLFLLKELRARAQCRAPPTIKMASPRPPHNGQYLPPAPPSYKMQHNSAPSYAPMASFAFKLSVPLTKKPVFDNFTLPPAASVAFSGEKHPMIVQPLKSAYSRGYVLHQDPAFRRDVQEFFGYAYPGGEPTTKYHSQTDVPPVYKAADDDLAVWRAGVGAEDVAKDGGKESDMEDRVKSAEDASRESLLEKLRCKLFNESP